MPPTAPTFSSIKHVLPLSKIFLALSHRAVAADTLTPLASVFALIIREPSSIHTRSLSALLSRTPRLEETLSSLGDSTLAKRQVYILAIPTTYAGLNAGPSPGVVVGIMLGSIAGFLLVGWIFLLLVRVYSGHNEIIVEEESDDIVEVIEEHSPERRESRTKRSGYRTVDPAEFGGGDAPRRSISRR
ncbi:hypothetical protein DV737_g4810, partial [Chaetothyriales sp. CBS 132003]